MEKKTYEDDRADLLSTMKEWSDARKKLDPTKENDTQGTQFSFFGISGRDVNSENLSKKEIGEWANISDRFITEAQLNEVVPTETIVPSYDADDDEDADVTGDEKIEKHGMKKDLAKGPGPEVKMNVNPIHFASVGTDQELRVQGGEKFIELAKMKSLLYSLESELLRADTLGENTSKIERQLKQLRKECHKLSDLLSPDPKTDVI